MTAVMTRRASVDLVEHDPNRYGVALTPLVLQFGEREPAEKFALMQVMFQGVEPALLARAIIDYMRGSRYMPHPHEIQKILDSYQPYPIPNLARMGYALAEEYESEQGTVMRFENRTTGQEALVTR